MNMKLKDIRDISCTNIKVYIGGKMVHSPFKGNIKPYLEKEVVWIDAEDDILVVGVRDTKTLESSMLSKMIDDAILLGISKGGEHNEKE